MARPGGSGSARWREGRRRARRRRARPSRPRRWGWRTYPPAPRRQGRRPLGSLAARDDDLGRADDPVADLVAGPDHLGDGVLLLVALLVGHDRLVGVWVEGLAVGVDALEAGALDDRAQVALDQEDPLDPALLALVGRDRRDGALEVVEDRQDRAGRVDPGRGSELVA